MLAREDATVISLRLFELLPEHPIVTVNRVVELLACSRPAAGKARRIMEMAEVVRPLDDRKKNRASVRGVPRRSAPGHGAFVMRVYGDLDPGAASELRDLLVGFEGLQVRRRRPARSSVPHPQSTDLELALKERLLAVGFEH
ncbi:MAG: hypothetical protein GXP62_16940, partial [Oligoflexia bacterium]|nr:hypothetical protein [Oligoflexia bacterium]